MPNTFVSCMCPGNQPSSMACTPSGSGYQPCACNAVTGAGGSAGTSFGNAGTGGSGIGGPIGSGAGGFSGMSAGTGGMSAGVGGTSAGAGGISAGSGGTNASTGGSRAGAGGVSAGTGGMTAGAGGMAAGTGGASSGDDLDAIRQLCVDTINMYRATMSLPALARETPDKETCSDMGAKQDAEANQAHGSAGMCFMSSPYFGAGQNTCPSLPVGGFGSSTLESSLKRCLQQMWDEGPPPAGTTIDQCIADRAQGGCFLSHGHWINMIQTMYKSVSCGFFKKPDGSYWGNQDFPIKR